MKPTPLTLVKREHWTDFNIGRFQGWAQFQEARTRGDGKHLAQHIAVTFVNGPDGNGAWRQVSVFGTESLRVAIRAAVPAAEASPIVRGRNEFGIVYGSYATVDLAKLRKTRLFAEELEAAAAGGDA